MNYKSILDCVSKETTLYWVRIFLMYCLVLLFSIAFVINKQWALLNVCWIKTHSWYLGFIRTHPNIYIIGYVYGWLYPRIWMDAHGCARDGPTLYTILQSFNLSRKITSRLITSTHSYTTGDLFDRLLVDLCLALL